MEDTNNSEQTVTETPAVEETKVVEETPVAAPAEEIPAPEAPVVETLAPVEEPKKEEQEVIGAPRYAGGSDTVQSVGVTNNGAIGTANVERPVKKAAAPKKAKAEDTVAILSTRNVTWNGVGKVYRGYNIVSKDAAEKWLTRDHCRIATPEEVARGFGK
jgi:hypothetical protein